MKLFSSKIYIVTSHYLYPIRNTVTVPGAFDATTDVEENHHNLISPLHQQHTDIALLSMTSVSKSVSKSLSKSKLPSKVQSKRSKRAILKLQVSDALKVSY